MAKVDIYSGFLGAGKTTIIKKLIKEALEGEKIVIIENEFGEIGIDGGFLKEAGINITEMNSGCICCSLVGDFEKSLIKVLKDYSPERIIIEPSGVGKLSDVIKAVKNVQSDELVLNNLVCVADASKCKVYMKNFGEFYNDQIESADAVILSRTDALSDEKISGVLALIRKHNDKAAVITTPWSEITGKQILDAIQQKNTLKSDLEMLDNEEVCPECGHSHHYHHHDGECCHHEHHGHDSHCTCNHHHASDVFTSIGFETANKYSADEIMYILQELNSERYGNVLRAKGIISGNDSWIHFDYTPGESDVRQGSADTIGKICIIGAELNADDLKKLFRV